MLDDSEQVERYAQHIIYEKQLDAKDLRRLQTLAASVRQRIASWRFDHYHNWGLQPPTEVAPCDLGDIHRLGAIHTFLLEQNWYYSTLDNLSRVEIIKRARAINTKYLLSLVERIIARLYGSNAVESVSVYGSYLYGHQAIEPDDLDLIVVLKNGTIIENNVTVSVSDLYKVFEEGTDRIVSSGKLGLSLFSRNVCSMTTRNEHVLDCACQEKGAGILLFGDGMSSAPVPLSILAYKVIPLLAWGYKHTLYDEHRFMVTGLSRVIEANRILGFLATKLRMFECIELTPDAEILEVALAQPQTSPKIMRHYYISESQKTATTVRGIHRVLRDRYLSKLEELLR